MALYPIAIEAGDENRAARIVVPDLPDCTFSADYQDDILTLAREAIGQWMAKAKAAGRAILRLLPLMRSPAVQNLRGVWLLALKLTLRNADSQPSFSSDGQQGHRGATKPSFT